MKIKVLKLPSWVACEIDPQNHFQRDRDKLLGTKRYQEIPVVFNRNGAYLHGNKCWLEVNGKAYSYDYDMFVYEMGMYHAERYNHFQAAALNSIVAQKLATKSQKRLLYYINQRDDLRNLNRSVRLSVLKWRKRKLYE